MSIRKAVVIIRQLPYQPPVSEFFWIGTDIRVGT